MIKSLTNLTGNFYFYLFLILLAVVLRSEHEIYFPQVESDYGVQIEAAKNFVSGKGFINCLATQPDLSKPNCEQLKLWPLGYPFLLVIGWYIFHNWIASAISWQVLSMLLLLFGMLRLLTLMEVSRRLKCLFLLFFAFTATPFYYWATTDMMVTAVFTWCVFIMLRIEKEQKGKWKHFILLGILSFFNCTIRFASIPNLVIIPIFYLLIGFIRKDKMAYMGAFLIAFISFGAAFLFFSINKIDSARTSFMDNLIHLNLYWGHLRWFDSFPSHSFFYTSPLEYRLSPNHLALIRTFRIFIHAVSISILLLLFRMFILKDKILSKFNSPVPEERIRFDFILLFVVASLSISGVMILQSLTTPPEGKSFGPAWMPYLWTFVYATRYFAIPMIMIQIMFFVGLSRTDFKHQIFFSRSAGLLIIVAVSWSLLYFAYSFRQIHLAGGNGGGSFWVNQKADLSVFHEINALAEKEKTPIVYAGYDLAMGSAPILEFSSSTLNDNYPKLLSDSLNVTDRLTLLIKFPPAAEMNLKEQQFVRVHQGYDLHSGIPEHIVRFDFNKK